MSTTHTPGGLARASRSSGASGVAFGVLVVDSVPRSTLNALSVRGAASGMSRAGYVRQLLAEHFTVPQGADEDGPPQSFLDRRPSPRVAVAGPGLPENQVRGAGGAGLHGPTIGGAQDG